MKSHIRALNERGLARFREWLESGAAEDAPFDLLNDPDTSEPIPGAGEVEQRLFLNRYDLAVHILEALGGCDFNRFSFHEGFWAWLSLFYFDLLSPNDGGGRRTNVPVYAFVLSSVYREYYRHLIRESVVLVREHGESAKVLLMSPTGGIKVTAALVELASRQELASNHSIIELAYRLYFDARRQVTRRGTGSIKKPGSIRRFAIVLQQLSLNFDLAAMSPRQIFELLPVEFDRWKRRATFNSTA